MEVDSLVGLVEYHASTVPDRTVFSVWTRGAWQEWSYAQLLERVRALAAELLETGLTPGARAAILADSGPWWATGYFAVLHAGATPVPLDPRSSPAELATITNHCRPGVILSSESRREQASSLSPNVVVIDGPNVRHGAAPRPAIPNPESLGVISYTSGTTGRPKGVMIAQSSLLYEARALSELHELDRDVFLSVLPLNHLLELTCGLLAPLYCGGEVVYGGSLLPAEIAQSMHDRRVTTMIGVPALYATIRRAIEAAAPQPFAHRIAPHVPRTVRRKLFGRLHRVAGGRMRRLICGGSSLDLETSRFYERLGVDIYQGYGMTEAGPVISVNGPGENRPESVGRPLPGTQVQIGEEHEIKVQGPQIMKGYLDDPEATNRAFDEGWLCTGDQGRIEDGFLYITGRIKDLIVLPDGRKVHPAEVEQLLAKHQSIEDLSVVGVPGERGEEVVAVIVLAAGEEAVAAEAEIRGLSLGLRDFRRPRRILFHPGPLPRTRTFKIRRHELRDWAAAQMNRLPAGESH